MLAKKFKISKIAAQKVELNISAIILKNTGIVPTTIYGGRLSVTNFSK